MNLAAIIAATRRQSSAAAPLTVTIAGEDFTAHGGAWTTAPDFDSRTGMAIESRVCSVAIARADLTEADVTVKPGVTTVTIGGQSATVTGVDGEASDAYITLALRAIAPTTQLHH